MVSLIVTIITVGLVLIGYEIGDIFFGSIRRKIEMKNEAESHILRDQYGIYNIDNVFKPKR